MPKVFNPNAVGNSLPGRVKKVARDLKDLAGSAVSAPFSMIVGTGGLIVNGLSQFLGGITGPLNVTGSIGATTAITAGTSLTSATLNVSGGAAIGGNLTGVNTGSAGAWNGADVRSANGPTNNITAARVACWLQNSDGLVGTATSSRRFKANEVTADVDPEAILSINVKFWNYIAEIAKRDDPTSPDYVGPNYHVALNFGPIAEDLHAAGLWMAVVYERNDDGSLKLDDTGEPIPFSIHDSLWGYLVQIAAQSLANRLDAVEARLDAAGL